LICDDGFVQLRLSRTTTFEASSEVAGIEGELAGVVVGVKVRDASLGGR
jgi:hypothetical protein